MSTTVSFIIPSYNSRQTLERTINSLLGQNASAHIKDIIVVDSSDDRVTREYLSSLDSKILTLILLNEKTMPAQGRNIGARQAQGNLLCFIDSDVYLAEDWLRQIISAYEGGCRIGCGSVSAPEFQHNNMLALAQLYLQFNESLLAGDRREIPLVPACNMFCSKELFVGVGGFPLLRASEDVLLCLNARKVTPIWFIPTAMCFHVFRESFRAYYRNQMMLGEYIIAYRKQYYRKWFYQGLWPLLFLPGFLCIKLYLIISRILKAGRYHCVKFIQSFPLFLLGLFFWGVGFARGCFQHTSNEKS